MLEHRHAVNAADAIGGEGGTIHVRTATVDLPPRGSAVIRSARCPRGCDLVDPTVRIGRHAGLRVLRRDHEHDTVVHLDPVYGCVNHHAGEACDEGTLADYSCPRCHASGGLLRALGDVSRLSIPRRCASGCGCSPARR